MRKRLLSTLLALSMALAMLPGRALAAASDPQEAEDGGALYQEIPQDQQTEEAAEPQDNSPAELELRNNATISVQEWQVLRQTNQYRMGKNLQPLSVFENLQKAANQRAYELDLLLDHNRPDGTDYSTVYADYPVHYSAAAENIAAGQPTSTDVMNDWLENGEHCANIENAAMTHLGVGYHMSNTTYWSQNFIGAACHFTNLQLSEDTIDGQPGTNLERLLTAADLTVSATCSQHGACKLPLIAAMCSGYDMDETAPQILIVSYGGQTAYLSITGSGHNHSWELAAENAPTCIEDGSRIYACSGCEETQTENIPAKGHEFVENRWTDGEWAGEPTGDFICNACGTLIPELLADAYSEAMKLDNKVYPRTASQEVSALKEYVEKQAEDLLSDLGSCSCTAETIACSLPQDGSNGVYTYRLHIRSNAPTLSGEVTAAPLTLVLPVDGGSEPTYYISIPTPEYGQVVPSTHHAAGGEQITLSVKANGGFLLSELTVTDIRGHEITLRDLGGGQYSFTMPSSQVTIRAVFSKEAKEPDVTTPAKPVTGTDTDPSDVSDPVQNPAPMPFADIHPTNWYYKDVAYVWQRNWMSGVSNTSFAPATATSRAMVWTVLARMHNIATDGKPTSAWYERGRLWAMQQQISDGTGPTRNVTREQLATMLWRNAGSPASAASLTRFTDYAAINSYAAAAMRWAVANSIMQGSDGRLNPRGFATRAEVAAMVVRYAESIHSDGSN